MKGDEKLWTILNDKLDTLRASNRLPEAIRVGQAALELRSERSRRVIRIVPSAWKSWGSFMIKAAIARRLGRSWLKRTALWKDSRMAIRAPCSVPRVGWRFYVTTWGTPRLPLATTKKPF